MDWVYEFCQYLVVPERTTCNKRALHALLIKEQMPTAKIPAEIARI